MRAHLQRLAEHTAGALAAAGQVDGQAQALGEGLSLNEMAQRLGVAQSTAFRWRHRFLACPNNQQARRLVGIAEADESCFLVSCKGQRRLLRKARHRGGKALAGCKGSEFTPVLMARDRAGVTVNLILETNKAVSVQAALKPLLPPDTILCTDGSVTLASYQKEAPRLCRGGSRSLTFQEVVHRRDFQS